PPFVAFSQALGGLQSQPTGVELAAAIRAFWEQLDISGTLQGWSEAAASMAQNSRESGIHSAVHLQILEEMNQWLDNLELAFDRTPLRLGDWLGVVEAGLANLSVGVIP